MIRLTWREAKNAAIGFYCLLLIYLAIQAPDSRFGSWLGAHGSDAIQSQFGSSVVGALAGAFFGAWAAQRIAERGRLRTELVQEVRSTNAAIAVAMSIFSDAVGLKKQYIQTLHERFFAQRAAVIEHAAKVAAGITPPEVALGFQADLLSLSRRAISTDTLRELIFGRLSLVGRPLNLFLTIEQTNEALQTAIDDRNRMVEAWRVAGIEGGPDFTKIYLGLPFAGGHVDMTHANLIETLREQTNHLIYFSKLLCDDLTTHGKLQVEKFKDHFSDEPPRAGFMDYSRLQAEGLIPDDADYPDWQRAFKKLDV